MAVFQYRALRRGQRIAGTVSADNSSAASARLRSDGYIILDLTEVNKRAKALNKSHVQDKQAAIRDYLLRLFIKKSQIEITLRQLSTILAAGVPILTALHAVAKQAPTLLNRTFTAIADKVRKGYSLERCISEEAPFFGKITIGLIAMGEANGTLDEMLAYSAELMEHSRKVKGQIVQAFMYPFVVVLGAFGVGYYMVAHVFPKIMTFIQKQGKNVQLPLPTRMLIQINDFMEIYGLYVLLAPIIIFAMFIITKRNDTMAQKIDHAVLMTPVIGKPFKDYANTMWCRTLGALLNSGINVLNALELVSSIMKNRYYKKQIDSLRGIVQQGGSLTKGLKTTQLNTLCPMSMTMVSASEESGGLSESFIYVADYSEEQLNRRVTILGKMVEPAIFIVVGAMVGFIYFAFFMAMLAATRSAR